MTATDRLDRLLGAVFGCALGDALGLPAEGGEKAILAERYPNGLQLPHATTCRDFPLNDWTDDTDQTVLVMRTIAAHSRGEAARGEAAQDFASRLVDWFNGGFPELGDAQGSGCGNLTWRVLRRPEFVTDPFAAAQAAIGPKAGNGALMRTAACAFAALPGAEGDAAAAEWARLFCLTTHSDPRCVASCVFQTQLLRELAAFPGASMALNIEAILRAMKAALASMPPAADGRELLKWGARSRTLAGLGLGERDARGYTFKTLGCAMWAFREALTAAKQATGLDGDPGLLNGAFFKSRMTALVMEGGDADTNGAVAGAVFGAAMGYAALCAGAEDWLAALPNRAWLEAEVRTFAIALGW